MAEIRSTIDLVMERTKGMTPSAQELEEARAREWEKKARGYLIRLAEGQIRTGDMNLILEDVPPEDRPELKQALVRVMVWNFDLEDDNEPVLIGLGVLAGDKLGSFIAEARALFKDFVQEKQGLDRGAAGHVLGELSAKGITGPALKPKFESDPQYTESLARMKEHYRLRLSKLQDGMLLAAHE